MERLLVVWCPDLLEEHETGREARAFRSVVEALGSFAARVDPVRPGVCAVPTRGPARYFGGRGGPGRPWPTDALAGTARRGRDRRRSVRRHPGRPGLAGSRARRRPPGRHPDLRRPVAGGHPGASRAGRPPRPLGIRTLGTFAALPGPEVLARFGADVAVCQRVARGVDGELPGFRLLFPGRPAGARPGGGGHPPGRVLGGEAPAPMPGPPGPWPRVQDLLGPEAVVTGRLQGGRGPAQRARLVPWSPPRPPAPTGGTTARRGHRAALAGTGPPAGPGDGARPAARRPARRHRRPDGGCHGGGHGHRPPGPAVGGRGAVDGGDRVGRALALRRAVVVGPGPAPPSPHAGRHRRRHTPTCSRGSGAAGGWRGPTTDAGHHP